MYDQLNQKEYKLIFPILFIIFFLVQSETHDLEGAETASPTAQLQVSYDAAGNLTRTNGFAETIYTYDGNSMLTSETVRYGNTAAGITEIISTIIIDETVPYPRVIGEDRRTFLSELDENDDLIRTQTERRSIAYAYGPSGLTAQKVTIYDGPEFNKIAHTELSYPQTDHLGSLIGLVDSDGNILLQRQYDAYGRIQYQEGNGWTTLGFAGERVDTGDGLIWIRARHYSPELRRWMQRDDFAGLTERPQSRNRYTYAEGDPVNNTDPSGNVAILPLIGLGAFIGGSALSTYGLIEGLNGQAETNNIYDKRHMSPANGLVSDLRHPSFSAVENARIAQAQRDITIATALLQLGDAITSVADYTGIRTGKPRSSPNVLTSNGRRPDPLYSHRNPTVNYQNGDSVYFGANSFGNGIQAELPYEGVAPRISPNRNNIHGHSGLPLISTTGARNAEAFHHHRDFLLDSDWVPLNTYTSQFQVPRKASVTILSAPGNPISFTLAAIYMSGEAKRVEHLGPEFVGARSFLPGSWMPNFVVGPLRQGDPDIRRRLDGPLTLNEWTALESLVHPNQGNVTLFGCLGDCVLMTSNMTNSLLTALPTDPHDIQAKYFLTNDADGKNGKDGGD